VLISPGSTMWPARSSTVSAVAGSSAVGPTVFDHAIAGEQTGARNLAPLGIHSYEHLCVLLPARSSCVYLQIDQETQGVSRILAGPTVLAVFVRKVLTYFLAWSIIA